MVNFINLMSDERFKGALLRGNFFLGVHWRNHRLDCGLNPFPYEGESRLVAAEVLFH